MKHISGMAFGAAAFAACLSASAADATAVPAPKPNIIIILADDVGYGDLGCYGATKLKTPNLDKLAAQGMRFTDAYAPAAVCTPTRFAMLTGKWAWRQNNTGILPGDAPLCIHAGTVTLPAMLQKAGYATGVVGKWHLGFGTGKADFNKPLKPGPREIGFDHAFVYPATNDRVPTVFVENDHVVRYDPQDPISINYGKKIGNEPDGVTHAATLRVGVRKNPDPHRGTINNRISRIGWMSGGKEARWNDEDLSDILAGRAVKFIEESKDRPFFLYFAPHTVHEPQVPAKRFQGSSQCGVYGDVLQELDWSVGEVMKALDRLGIADNTLVIFGSDNGAGLYQNESYQYEEGGRDPCSHARNGKLHGGKGDQWEGGTRVPFIARWPAKIKAGGTSAELLSLVDMPATGAAIVEQKLPAGAAPDSVNVLPALLGTGAGREFVIQQHYRGSGNLAIRKGPWKLFPWGKGAQLYNLAEDIGETKDVVAQHPEIVKELLAQLAKVRAGAIVTAKSDVDDLKPAILPSPVAAAAEPPPAPVSNGAGVAVKDGVIHCFPDGAKDGVIAHCQIEGKKLWVDAVRRGGKTRQVRVTSYVGNQGTQTPVKLFWPEIADGTITWNLAVKREGDVVSVMLPWNGVLIGDLMDVNEGEGAAAAIRKKLGVDSGADANLPVLYSSGDSISMCYWPYLEADLGEVANVYYQKEVSKDIPASVEINNGHAQLAWNFLEAAYKDPRFKPKYILMNFGLHMIATHQNKVADYGQWIEKMDDLSKQHDAQLIWVTTTPYEQAFRPAQNLVILQFNDTAKAIAAKRGIPVVDLHACTLAAVKELGDKKVYEDGVHFTDTVRQRQAAFIAVRVREIMKDEGKGPRR